MQLLQCDSTSQHLWIAEMRRDDGKWANSWARHKTTKKKKSTVSTSEHLLHLAAAQPPPSSQRHGCTSPPLQLSSLVWQQRFIGFILQQRLARRPKSRKTLMRASQVQTRARAHFLPSSHWTLNHHAAVAFHNCSNCPTCKGKKLPAVK